MNKLSVVLLVAATTASALRVASGPATPKAGIGRRQAAACLVGAALASSNVAPSLADEADFPAPPPAPSIKVEILEKGDASSPTPQRAQNVVVDYTLWVDGFEKKLVDSSKGSAFPPKLPSPFKFTVGVGQGECRQRITLKTALPHTSNSATTTTIPALFALGLTMSLIRCLSQLSLAGTARSWRCTWARSDVW